MISNKTYSPCCCRRHDLASRVRSHITVAPMPSIQQKDITVDTRPARAYATARQAMTAGISCPASPACRRDYSRHFRRFRRKKEHIAEQCHARYQSQMPRSAKCLLDIFMAGADDFARCRAQQLPHADSRRPEEHGLEMSGAIAALDRCRV